MLSPYKMALAQVMPGKHMPTPQLLGITNESLQKFVRNTGLNFGSIWNCSAPTIRMHSLTKQDFQRNWIQRGLQERQKLSLTTWPFSETRDSTRLKNGLRETVRKKYLSKIVAVQANSTTLKSAITSSTEQE